MNFSTRGRPHRFRAFVALLLAGSLIVAACGNDDSPAEAAGEGTATTGSDSGGGDDDGAEGEADPAGTLTVAFHLSLNTLDPLQNTNIQNVAWQFPVYDALLHRTPEGELEPQLAKSWEWSDDGSQLVLELQEGVTFHDGSTLDAEVVKANLDRLIEVESSPVKAAVANVASVEVTGPMTVTLNMTAPDASLPYHLADRAGMMVSGEALAEDVDLSTTAVGAGPYKVVEFVPSDRATYERFDDYWGDPAEAGVQTLELIAISDGQARLNGLQAGEFDAAYITPSQAGQVESAGLELVTNPSLWYIQLYLNRSKSELGTLEARQAISHAIDREAICEAIYFGYCEVTSQPFFEGTPFHVGGIVPDYYDYDPERSRELLEQAGLGDGFTFELMIPAGSDPYPQLAELLKAQLAEVGITAELNPVDISQLATSYFAEGNSDALLGGGGQQPDPTQFFSTFATSTAFANPGGVTSKGMDDLVAEMRATLDPEAQAELVREGVQTIVDDVHNFIMYRPEIIWGLQDNVVGWNENQVANYPIVRGVGVTSG